MNKAGLAAFFGISLPTCDTWIRLGAPAIEKGDAGKPWQFDLLRVAEWRFTPKSDAATEADARPDPATERAKLDRARRAEIEMRTAARAGELIEAREFERALSEPLKHVAMVLESLPDLLERDAGLTGAAVDKAIEVIDKLREDLYQAIIAGATHD